MRKNWDTFLIQTCDILEFVDIIILTETALNDYETSLYNITMFDKICINDVFGNQGNYKGRGIIIFYKNNINFSVEHDQINPAETLRLNLNKSNYHLTLVALYRSPSTEISIFLTNLSNWLEMNKLIKNILIIGDINIDIKCPSKPGVEEYLNICAFHGLEHKINDYTRVELLNDNVTKTCIDHILFKTKNLNINTAICLQKPADHYYILANINSREYDNNINTTNMSKTSCDKIKKVVNDKSLIESINSTNWGDICSNISCPISLYNTFRSKWCELTKQSEKYIKIKNRKTDKIWINYEIKELIYKRDKLWIKWKNNPKNINHKENYSRVRNEVNKAIRSRKKSYYSALIQQANGNGKKIWNHIIS